MILVLFSKVSIPSDTFIRCAVAEYCKLFGIPSFPFEIIRSAGEKPRLQHNTPYSLSVSLSHSGDYVAVAVSDFAVGLDIERKRELDYPALSKRFFGKEITDQDQFFEEWTKRESYVKNLGNGFPQRMVEEPKARVIPFSHGYAAAVSGEGAVFLLEWIDRE